MGTVMLTFVLLTFGVAFFSVPGVFACIDRAKPGVGMVGGWKRTDLANADDLMRAKAAAYAAEAIVEMNKLSDEATPYKLTTNPKTGEYSVTEVYTQVVAGVNYCIRFEVGPAGCRNSINHEDCDNDKKMCEAEVWEQPLLIEGRPKVTISEIKCE